MYTFGYQYGEALLAMMCNFVSGGNRTEDINVLKGKLPQRPGFRICSPDTVLRCLSELSVEDVVYTSPKGREYRFNTAERLNGLLVYTAVRSGLLMPGHEYDLDFDHEFLESETWESLPTYKGFRGYIIRNFYQLMIRMKKLRAFGVQATTRMKAFVNKVINVVAKWTKGGRRNILTIYTDNGQAYAALYADYG